MKNIGLLTINNNLTNAKWFEDRDKMHILIITRI